MLVKGVYDVVTAFYTKLYMFIPGGGGAGIPPVARLAL